MQKSALPMNEVTASKIKVISWCGNIVSKGYVTLVSLEPLLTVLSDTFVSYFFMARQVKRAYNSKVRIPTPSNR